MTAFDCVRQQVVYNLYITYNVVYQATVTTETATETYVGLATNFKEQYRNHKTSFRNAQKRNETELSKHIWKLKDYKNAFQIQWKVLNNVNRI